MEDLPSEADSGEGVADLVTVDDIMVPQAKEYVQDLTKWVDECGGMGLTLKALRPALGAGMPHLKEEQRTAVTAALEEDVPEAVEFINSSITRMDGHISAVLKLSRVGRRRLVFERLDMDVMVGASLDTLAHQIKERQVEVAVDALSEVVADRTAMEQVFGNLLTNAVLNLEPGRPAEIEVTAESRANETVSRVRDNGRGIAGKDMEKVFAPFRRAGKQDVPGEGMGLAYVQTLARRHGGRIWCESELGMGTTFGSTIDSSLAEGGNHVRQPRSAHSVGGR